MSEMGNDMKWGVVRLEKRKKFVDYSAITTVLHGIWDRLPSYKDLLQEKVLLLRWI